jgi:hypothetical protein
LSLVPYETNIDRGIEYLALVYRRLCVRFPYGKGRTEEIDHPWDGIERGQSAIVRSEGRGMDLFFERQLAEGYESKGCDTFRGLRF